MSRPAGQVEFHLMRHDGSKWQAKEVVFVELADDVYDAVKAVTALKAASNEMVQQYLSKENLLIKSSKGWTTWIDKNVEVTIAEDGGRVTFGGQSTVIGIALVLPKDEDSQ